LARSAVVLAVTLFVAIVWAMHFIYGNTWDAR
jgi:hypothetical protein